MPNTQFTSRFIEDTPTTEPTDLGVKYVTKEYMMEIYPELVPNMKAQSLWGWGWNAYSQLGPYTAGGSISTPTSNVLTEKNRLCKQMSVSDSHSVMILNDGTLWSTGRQVYGSFGINAAGDSTINTPTQENTNSTNWSSAQATEFGTIGIKSDNTMWAVGLNSSGKFGLGATTSFLNYTQISGSWRQLSACHYHSYALGTDGSIYSAGYGGFGGLGLNDTTGRTAFTKIGTGTDWAQISGGSCWTLSVIQAGAIKKDGSLYMWGYNLWGSVGDGTVTHRSSPVRIGSGNDWKSLHCGPMSTLAIKTDGTLWAWGINQYGELGTNSTSAISSPVQVGTSTMWKSISFSNYSTYGLKTDGTLWTWGRNTYGELGNGNIGTNVSSPIQVGTNTNWRALALSDGQDACAIAISEVQGY